MRAFIAIDIPFLPAIHDLRSDLSAQLNGIHIQYVNPEQFHITLAFLGDISVEESQTISTRLKIIPNEIKKFALTLSGVGVFKSIRQPQTLWIGIQPNPALQNLWKKTLRATSNENTVTEKETFSPHLTLGRVKKYTRDHNLELFLKKYEQVTFGNVPINRFTLYSSTLTPNGPIYRPVHRLELI